MDEYIYNLITRYFTRLSNTGYVPYGEVDKILVLVFIRNLVANDYRGYLTDDSYHIIEKALECLFGSSCLVTYKDYLKMGKLKLGDVSELAHRLCKLETTKVIKKREEVIEVPDIDVSDITEEIAEEK